MIKPTKGSSSVKPKELEASGKGKEVAKIPEKTPKGPPGTEKYEEIARKLEEEEERQKASLTRERKLIYASEVRIWPVWTKAKIAKDALPATDPYWLSPIATIRVNTNANFQIDMPITPRAFIFKHMEPLSGVEITDQKMNEILIEFYARSAKPQQDVWSCLPIKTIPRF